MTILSTTSSATSTLSQSSAPSSPSTSNTVIARANAVGEGVISGILILFMFCALLYGCFQWKKRLTRNRKVLLLAPQSDTENPQAAASEVIEEPSMTRVRVIPPVLPFVSSHSCRSFRDPFLIVHRGGLLYSLCRAILYPLQLQCCRRLVQLGSARPTVLTERLLQMI